MISIEIDISDAQAKLDRLGDPYELSDRIANRIADDVALPNLAKYPGQRRMTQPFVSDKQRRYFFASLHDGTIKVPYPRTGALGDPGNWARITLARGGVELWSVVWYSDRVRTRGRQASYHEGNWPTTDDIAEQSEGDAALTATAELVTIITGAGLGP